jgi:hypothetical protein
VGCGNWQQYTLGPITLSPNPRSIAKTQMIEVVIYDSGSSSVVLGSNAATSAYNFSDSVHIPSSLTFVNGIAN